MIRRIYYCFIRLINKYKFGEFGYGSAIIKPLRLLNKQYIYIGSHVRIAQGARIEAITEYMGEKFNGKVIIEDGTTIEQHCHIIGANEVNIGKNCMISARVFISDCEHNYANVKMPIHRQGLNTHKTIIGEGTFIGINAVIEGVTIGEHCIIGANAVVIKDVPAYCMVAGVPAKIIKRYDVDSGDYIADMF